MSGVYCLIQARLGSQRFPQKILADLCGHPVLWHVYQRARQIRGVDAVKVIVPSRDVDAIHRAVPSVPLLAFMWPEEDDVLGRYQRAATSLNASTIMRITADCPALDPDVASQVLALYQSASECAFVSNDTLASGYPDGWDIEVFSRALLERAHAEATDPADREHVTSWMRRSVPCLTLRAPRPWTGPKLSIDTPADLEVVRAWMAHEGAASDHPVVRQ